MSRRDLEDNMTRLALDFKRRAQDLRDTAAHGGVDAGLNKYFEKQMAQIWDKAGDEILREIRDTNRWHQEPT